jgi:hypothetical protein
MTGGVSLDPATIYDDGSLYCLLGLSSSTLTRARRSGLLRFTKQGKRILYLGSWVHEWLASDSHSRRGVGVANAC